MRNRDSHLLQSIFRAPSRPFFILTISTALIYLVVFTLPFLLPRYFNTIPPVDYAKLTNHSAGGLLVYVAGLLGLLALYLFAINLMKPAEAGRPASGLSVGHIFGGSALFGVILLFSYPLTAIDLFVYALRTRGWGLYNLPPLATPPELLPASDPWLGLAGEWIDAASPYGPVWEGLSLAAFYLSGGDYLAHLFSLKLIGLLAYLGGAGLVYLILKATRPEWALAGALAFAWNPLVLFESVQNAHNDSVMILLLLAAVWLLAAQNSGRRGPANTLANVLVCLLLALSILVKFVTILVVPFFLLALGLAQPDRRRRAGVRLLYAALIAAIVLAAMGPVWPGWENWAVVTASNQAGRSLLATMVLGLRPWLGTSPAFDTARAVILGLFGLIYLYWLRRGWRAENSLPETVIAPSFQVLFWYVLLVAPVFHAWYLLWVAPLASLLLPRQRPLQAVVVFSMTALLAIPYFETVRVWYPVLLQNQLLGHVIGVPLLIAPPALTLLWPISPAEKSGV